MNKTPLKGHGVGRDDVGRLTNRGTNDGFIVSVFKPKGPKLISTRGSAINRTIFRNEAGPLYVEMNIQNPPAKKNQVGLKKERGRKGDKRLIAAIGDAIRAKGTIFKVGHEVGNGVHGGGLHVNAGPLNVKRRRKFDGLGREDTSLGESTRPAWEKAMSC